MNKLKRWWVFLLVCLVCVVPTTAFADSVRVNRTDLLIKLIRQAVQNQYKIASNNVLILWNDQDLEEKLSKMGSGLTVEVNDQDLSNLISRSSILLKVMQGDQYKGRIPIRLKVDAWVDAYQTTRALAPDEALSANVIEAQRIRLSELPAQVVRAPFRLEDYQARQAIAAKTILSLTLLKERPLVVSGTQVRVVVIDGALRLVARGESLETGIRNQWVRVKILNFGTEKIIKARVTDAGEVTYKIDA